MADCRKCCSACLLFGPQAETRFAKATLFRISEAFDRWRGASAAARLGAAVCRARTEEEEVRALLAAITACAEAASSSRPALPPRSRRRQLPAEVRRRFAELREHLTVRVTGRSLLSTAFRLFAAGVAAAAACRRQQRNAEGLAVLASGRRRAWVRARRALDEAEARRLAERTADEARHRAELARVAAHAATEAARNAGAAARLTGRLRAVELSLVFAHFGWAVAASAVRRMRRRARVSRGELTANRVDFGGSVALQGLPQQSASVVSEHLSALHSRVSESSSVGEGEKRSQGTEGSALPRDKRLEDEAALSGENEAANGDFNDHGGGPSAWLPDYGTSLRLYSESDVLAARFGMGGDQSKPAEWDASGHGSRVIHGGGTFDDASKPGVARSSRSAGVWIAMMEGIRNRYARNMSWVVWRAKVRWSRQEGSNGPATLPPEDESGALITAQAAAEQISEACEGGDLCQDVPEFPAAWVSRAATAAAAAAAALRLLESDPCELDAGGSDIWKMDRPVPPPRGLQVKGIDSLILEFDSAVAAIRSAAVTSESTVAFSPALEEDWHRQESRSNVPKDGTAGDTTETISAARDEANGSLSSAFRYGDAEITSQIPPTSGALGSILGLGLQALPAAAALRLALRIVRTVRSMFLSSSYPAASLDGYEEMIRVHEGDFQARTPRSSIGMPGEGDILDESSAESAGDQTQRGGALPPLLLSARPAGGPRRRTPRSAPQLTAAAVTHAAAPGTTIGRSPVLAPNAQALFEQQAEAVRYAQVRPALEFSRGLESTGGTAMTEVPWPSSMGTVSAAEVTGHALGDSELVMYPPAARPISQGRADPPRSIAVEAAAAAQAAARYSAAAVASATAAGAAATAAASGTPPVMSGAREVPPLAMGSLVAGDTVKRVVLATPRSPSSRAHSMADAVRITPPLGLKAEAAPSSLAAGSTPESCRKLEVVHMIRDMNLCFEFEIKARCV